MPKISVIIPTYNRAHLLGETLDSVLNLPFKDLEIIVVDDGSTDDTAQLMQSYPNVRYVWQENLGISFARNAGIELATGCLLHFLDSDDYMLDEVLYREGVKAFEQDETLDAVHSGWLVLQDGVFSPQTPWEQASMLNLESWLTVCPVRLGGMLFHRRIFDAGERFGILYKISEDTALLLRVAWSGARWAWVKHITHVYRIHAHNIIKTVSNKFNRTFSLFKTYLDDPACPPHIASQKSAILYKHLVWAVARVLAYIDVEDAQELIPELASYSPYQSKWDGISQVMTMSVFTFRFLIEPDTMQRAFIDADATDAEEVSWWVRVWWWYFMRRQVVLEPLDLYYTHIKTELNHYTDDEKRLMMGFTLLRTPYMGFGNGEAHDVLLARFAQDANLSSAEQGALFGMMLIRARLMHDWRMMGFYAKKLIGCGQPLHAIAKTVKTYFEIRRKYHAKN